MATFGNLETEVEPLAGLMRDHLEVQGDDHPTPDGTVIDLQDRPGGFTRRQSDVRRDLLPHERPQVRSPALDVERQAETVAGGPHSMSATSSISRVTRVSTPCLMVMSGVLP